MPEDRPSIFHIKRDATNRGAFESHDKHLVGDQHCRAFGGVRRFFLALPDGGHTGGGSGLWKAPNVYGSLSGGLKASVTGEIITRLRVGDMTVSLDETPIENVRAKFAATIGSTGDASGSFTWICAQGTDPDGR